MEGTLIEPFPLMDADVIKAVLVTGKICPTSSRHDAEVIEVLQSENVSAICCGLRLYKHQ
jgi:hypothetical protein